MFGSKYRKYEKKLVELIAIALNKNNFENLVSRIYKGKTIDNIKPESTEGFGYIEKILTEEIEKQFGDPNRPFIELVLNAIDAKPDDFIGDYTVTVLTKFNEFIVSDNGASMSLDEVLSNFIIPFYSKKSNMEDIGRFGVGFLSNLSFVLEQPRLIYVKVNISREKDAFQIMFHSESENVKDIVVTIERVEPLRQGTDVIITRDLKKSPGLIEYLTRYLEYFNPDNAKIRINKRIINFPQKGETIIRKFPFKKEGKEIEQAIRMTFDFSDTDGENYVKFYSQGVFISQIKMNFGNVKIDFPTVIDVVEGRDEFKQDENYIEAMNYIWQLVLAYLKQLDLTNIENVNNMRELIPCLEEAIGKKMPAPGEFIKLIFPHRTYVADSKTSAFKEKDFKNISDFFGPEIFDYLYQPRTTLSEERWREVLGSSMSLVDEFSETRSQGFLSNCMPFIEETDTPFHNVDFLKEKTYYRFVNIQTKGGVSPFLRMGELVYVNIGSKFFHIENDFISEFNNRVNYMRASGNKEKDIGKEFK